MNQTEKTLLCGFMGTNIMTLSSAMMSLIFNENFKEPGHLATLIGRLAPALSKKARQLAGWGAHYAMGVVFAAVYVELWETGKIRHTIRNGIILGAVSGIAGLLIWKGTFKAHPFPPRMKYDHYYLQRIPAHIVFAVFATITYRLIQKKESSN
ncbi:hypothetical protein [Mucilaginibacter endophyticus]|uniref:hypothetical protein n=1 Tax=Mucilaginibacter endophyticus TaxID=2675003 RepID=UPI000E0D63D4|nr:hypothetical protein [Mucilaginibacter endophyticus]